jgi:hypothetical protein
LLEIYNIDKKLIINEKIIKNLNFFTITPNRIIVKRAIKKLVLSPVIKIPIKKKIYNNYY